MPRDDIHLVRDMLPGNAKAGAAPDRERNGAAPTAVDAAAKPQTEAIDGDQYIQRGVARFLRARGPGRAWHRALFPALARRRAYPDSTGAGSCRGGAVRCDGRPSR